MKKNITILLFLCCFVAVMLLLFGWFFPFVISTFFFVPYVRSGVLLLIFILVTFTKRLTWKNHIVFLVAAIALVGMLIDTSGNPLYNKPAEFMASSIGELYMEENIDSYSPGEYSITNHIRIETYDGKTLDISPVFLYLYRFIQYLILYSLLASVFGMVAGKIPQPNKALVPHEEAEVSPELQKKMEEKRREREEEMARRRIVPEEILGQALELKQSGQFIKAIKLVKDHTDLSLAEAKQIVEDL